jgi:hypothetical protein
MPWVRFIADFDFKPAPRITLAFHAGQVRLVTTACAAAASTKGKAVRATKPKDEKHGG